MASASAGSFILFAGGTAMQSSSYFPDVDIFDSSSSKWSTASLTISRSLMAAATLGSRAFFAGGSNSTDYQSIVDIFDDSTGNWSVESLSVARSCIAATAVGNKVIFAGGFSSTTSYSNVVDIYDVVSRNWSLATLSVGRNRLAATTVGRFAIFAGGYSSSGYSAASDIYDSSSDTWYTSETIPLALWSPQGGGDVASGADLPIIIGAAVGGVAVLGIIGFLVYWLVIRKKKLDNSSIYSAKMTPTNVRPGTRNTLGNDRIPQDVLTLSDFIPLLELTGKRRDTWKGSKAFEVTLQSSSEEYGLIMSAFRRMDGENLLDAIVSVKAVVNPQIALNFIGHRELLSKRLESDPQIFKKDDWKTLRGSGVRSWMINQYRILFQQYAWNSVEMEVPVVPFLHGTDAAIARKIIDTGFSAISSLDAGFYGRGIYFTSKAQYALPYFATKAHPCLILCLTMPGNTFPVYEGYQDPDSRMGTPIKSGYQSNYVVTHRSGIPCEKMQFTDFYDELVLDQEAQVVPFAIIEFDKAILAPYAFNFQRVVPGLERKR